MGDPLVVDDDIRLKKVLDFRQSGLRLRFKVAQDLFSSHEVDLGTKFLLRTLNDPIHRRRHKVLDMGCGYGPIGLALKAEEPMRLVHMVDRDALAVEYSRMNAELNELDEDVVVYGSLGFDDVTDKDFDLIVSNIPGKAGEEVIRHLLLDSRPYLAPEGLVAVVVVLPLTDFVRDVLGQEEGVEILYERSTKRYTVFHFHFESTPAEPPTRTAFDLGVYDRQAASMRYRKHRWDVTTVRGLSEFDSLSFHSELAIDALMSLRADGLRRVAFLNPGQGHVPTVTWYAREPESIQLFDRDLLSLRCSRRNLTTNGCPPERVAMHHCAKLVEREIAPVDAFVLMPPGNELPDVVLADLRMSANAVTGDGMVVLAAKSTVVARCLERLALEERTFTVQERVKKKGFSAVTMRVVS